MDLEIGVFKRKEDGDVVRVTVLADLTAAQRAIQRLKLLFPGEYFARDLRTGNVLLTDDLEAVT